MLLWVITFSCSLLCGPTARPFGGGAALAARQSPPMILASPVPSSLKGNSADDEAAKKASLAVRIQPSGVRFVGRRRLLLHFGCLDCS